MKTLVVAPNWIGDALMAQPLLTSLKAADPDGEIVALAPRWVAPVLEAMPEADRVIATDLAHGKLQWRARRALAKVVARERFDRALVLPNSFKSALVPWLAGIPERVGYRGESRFVLIDRTAPGPDAGLSMAARYAALAKAAGAAVAEPLPKPHLVVDRDEIARVREKHGVADGDLIAICPGAEYGPAKRWPVEHFASLSALALQRWPNARVAILGGDGDRPLARGIVGASGDFGRLHDLTGRTTLAEAIALIASATSVVSNDSGLMHIAAALGRPQVALFGSSDPRHTPPLSDRATTLWLHLDCSPCFARTCPLGHLACLTGIPPGRVLDSMQNTSPSKAADIHDG